jgi:hypothetical protein
MYLVFSVGVGLWLIYGLLLGAWPIVLANAITLVLTLVVRAYKLREHGGETYRPLQCPRPFSAPAIPSTVSLASPKTRYVLSW